MKTSARNKLLVVLIPLFIFSVAGSVLYFLKPSFFDGLNNVSLVSNEWDVYGDIYTYAKDYEVELQVRSFSVDMYVVEVLDDTTLDVIVYNPNVVENLRTEITIGEEVEIEEGSNYVLTVSKNTQGIEKITGLEKIDVLGMKKEYLWKLFEMLEYNQGFNEVGLDWEFSTEAELMGLAPEVSTDIEGRDVWVDALNIVAIQRLSNMNIGITEGQMSSLEEYLEKNLEFLSIENSKFPCYSASLLEEEFEYDNSDYEGESVLDYDYFVNIVESKYLENSVGTSLDENLLLLLDEVTFCEAGDEQAVKLNHYIKDITYIENINKGTIYLLSNILQKFGEKDYLGEEVFTPDQYVNPYVEVDLDTVELFSTCVVGMCDKEELLNKLPMHIRYTEEGNPTLYTEGIEKDLNVSLFILALLRDE